MRRIISGSNFVPIKSQSIKTMATIKTNIWGLEVGDKITFTNSRNYKVILEVVRVEEKSWYASGRNSWGTLQSFTKYPDFKIIKSEKI